MYNNIGIIGQGFVGNAVYQGLKTDFNTLTYDKYVKDKSNSNIEEIVNECKVIFICLPTPMNTSTGECYIGIIETVLVEIEKLAKALNKKLTLVLKSTVPPGTVDYFNSNLLEYCNLVFNPEFLTEANAVNDFKTQDRIILGGNNTDEVYNIYKKTFKEANIVVTSAIIAEMVKYTTNCFLSTKVSFANEIYDICRGLNIYYEEMIEIAKLDNRLGKSHWMVPGPDGYRGFGGTCFPKDLQAIRYLASQLKLNTPVLNGTWETNNEVRQNRDWEDQEGRAVIHIQEQ